MIDEFVCAADAVSPARRRWSIILAGGDGKRLLPLTRRLAGDDRPKQFCSVLGGDTLLDQTMERVRRTIPAGQTLILLTKAHERYFRDKNFAPSQTLIQPQNRGTAAAILYGLTRLLRLDCEGVAAIFPSDHYIGRAAVLAAHLDAALAYAERSSDVVLLGVVPDGPEQAYGWIEPGAACGGAGDGALFRVSRFWEKPSLPVARGLLAAGCLWNSFIMVGRTRAFWELTCRALPAMASAFLENEGSIETLYASMPCVNFSAEVLSAHPEVLAVERAGDLDWTDLGEPDRVFALAARRPPAPAVGPPLAARIPA